MKKICILILLILLSYSQKSKADEASCHWQTLCWTGCAYYPDGTKVCEIECGPVMVCGSRPPDGYFYPDSLDYLP